MKKFLIAAFLLLAPNLILYGLLEKGYFCLKHEIDIITYINLFVSLAIAIAISRISKKISEQRYEKELLNKDISTLFEILSKIMEIFSIPYNAGLDISISEQKEIIKLLRTFSNDLDLLIKTIALYNISTYDYEIGPVKDSFSFFRNTISGSDAFGGKIFSIPNNLSVEVNRAHQDIKLKLHSLIIKINRA